MPFVVEHRDSTNAAACPVDRPWGVYTQNERGGPGVGEPHGCHETEAAAKKQQAALYVHVPEARAVTRKPWNGAASRYADTAAYCKACLIDDNPAGEEKTQAKCHLPVYEPNGDVNANALSAALAALHGGRGGVSASAEGKASALRKLRRLYAQAGMEFPEQRGTILEWLDEQREIRSAAFQPIDVADDGSWFEGYAAVFDEEAEFEVPGVGLVSESVQRGAFRKALAASGNIPMLYHHLDTHPPLATTHGGTLLLEENAKGLRTRADVAKGYIGDAVRELVKRGDIPGMSWGFIAGKGNSKVERRSDGNLHRTLVGFKKILDVSPTWDPTYRGTEAQFRARTFGLSFSPEEMQQLHSGYDVTSREWNSGIASTGDASEEEIRSLERESDGSGATRRRSVAARKRALQLLILETGGIDDETR